MSTISLDNTGLQQRTVTVSSAAMPQLLGQPALEFLSMRGAERLGKLFEYELLLRTPDDYSVPLATSATLDLKALLGNEMTVTVELDGMGAGATGGVGAGTREISGIVVEADFLHREDRYNVYRAVLRPWLWLATLTTDYKIFQDMTVVDILDEVLADYPYPVEKRLDLARYAIDGESERNEPRAYQVQYGETDFSFMQRLMEEWGIYWFFEHANGAHRLILCDNIGAHHPPDSAEYRQLQYQPEAGKIDTEYVDDFAVSESLQSGHYLTSDFDFTRSRADMRAINQQPRGTNWDAQEIFEYPGDYTDSQHGALLARTRMEALRAPGTHARAAGNVRGLACGQTFVLAGYDRPDANDEYLVIEAEIELTGTPDETGSDYQYACRSRFDLQPTSEVFRLPRVTPKPVVSGPQSALVVGPEGERVWTDEFGRVKVRFPWDRYGQNRETDSCWIRVSQAWAGDGFGGIFIPRIGQEVIVDFWNGDPDRPVILGALYNTITPTPWVLPANATQTGLMSRTIDGGAENYNAVRFDDVAGAEELMIQAENAMNILTKVNESHIVGVNQTTVVGVTQSVTVGAAQNITVGGAQTTLVGLDLSSNVVGAADYCVGLAQNNVIGGALNTIVGGAEYMTVGGASGRVVGGIYTLTVGGMFSLVVGDSSLTMFPDGTIKLVGSKITVSGSDEVVVQGGSLKLNPGSGDGGGCGCEGDSGGAPELTGVIAAVVNVVNALPALPLLALGAAGAIPGALTLGASLGVGISLGVLQEVLSGLTTPPATTPTETDPSGTYPTETDATETYPTETYPTETYPTETYPTETYPTETYPPETTLP